MVFSCITVAVSSTFRDAYIYFADNNFDGNMRQYHFPSQIRRHFATAINVTVYRAYLIFR